MEDGSSPDIHVDQDAAACQLIQDLMCFGNAQLPYLFCLFGGERFNWQPGHETGFPFGKEHFQDLEKELRWRRALGESVEAFGKVLVCGSGCQVSQGISSGNQAKG